MFWLGNPKYVNVGSAMGVFIMVTNTNDRNNNDNNKNIHRGPYGLHSELAQGRFRVRGPCRDIEHPQLLVGLLVWCMPLRFVGSEARAAPRL